MQPCGSCLDLDIDLDNEDEEEDPSLEEIQYSPSYTKVIRLGAKLQP